MVEELVNLKVLSPEFFNLSSENDFLNLSQLDGNELKSQHQQTLVVSSILGCRISTKRNFRRNFARPRFEPRKTAELGCHDQAEGHARTESKRGSRSSRS